MRAHMSAPTPAQAVNSMHLAAMVAMEKVAYAPRASQGTQTDVTSEMVQEFLDPPAVPPPGVPDERKEAVPLPMQPLMRYFPESVRTLSTRELRRDALHLFLSKALDNAAKLRAGKTDKHL